MREKVVRLSVSVYPKQAEYIKEYARKRSMTVSAALSYLIIEEHKRERAETTRLALLEERKHEPWCDYPNNKDIHGAWCIDKDAIYAKGY